MEGHRHTQEIKHATQEQKKICYMKRRGREGTGPEGEDREIIMASKIHHILLFGKQKLVK